MNNKYAIQMIDINKIYGNLNANDNINLSVKEGEIHGIIGENGAGKSTLMSILFGLIEPTSGYIMINGIEKKIKNSLDAEKLGIGMVHQHFKLIDIYNAVENIILGDEPLNKFGLLNIKKANKIIKDLLEKYKFDINLKIPVSQLTVGQQQKIEIVKLLYRNSNILIFDEPTGVLTPQEITEFLNLLKYFKSNGKTIILISHKLNEIKSICDRATIIRRGKVVKVVDVKKTTITTMSSLMVGSKIKEVKNKSKVKKDSPIIFCVNNLNKKLTKDSMSLNNINFNIKKGEILAIAGVEGNGQKELVDLITGLQKHNIVKNKDANMRASIKIEEDEIINKSIKERYDLGLSHIPEDRLKYGLILDTELKNSLFLKWYNEKPFAKHGFLVDNEITNWSRELIKKFDIRGANGGEMFAKELSGGNQQKAIIARETSSSNNKIIIIVQPTRGLDVGAINNVHKEILRKKDEGVGILLISYELPEIFALADRILVISKGSISKELNPKKITYKEIGLLMGGYNNSQKRKDV